MGRRFGLALAGFVGLLVALEVGARFGGIGRSRPVAAGDGDAVPLVGEVEASTDRRPPYCRPPIGGLPVHPAWRQAFGRDGGPEDADPHPWWLWVAGDSVAWGSGVERSEAFATRLAEHLAARSGRSVRLTDLGIPGADYCDTVGELHLRLDQRQPDLVVWTLQADDLEPWARFSGGRRVGRPPSHTPSDLARRLSAHSALADRLWMAVGARVAPAERVVDPASQQRFREAVGLLRDRCAHLGVDLVVALVPPAGLPLCDRAEVSARSPRCANLRSDMDLVAALLERDAAPFVDLRALWETTGEVVGSEERRQWLEEGRLPIHPDARGHRAIADRVWPVMAATLPDAPQARPLMGTGAEASVDPPTVPCRPVDLPGSARAATDRLRLDIRYAGVARGSLLVELLSPGEGGVVRIGGFECSRPGRIDLMLPAGLGDVWPVAFIDLQGDGPTAEDPAGAAVRAIPSGGSRASRVDVFVLDSPVLGGLAPPWAGTNPQGRDTISP